MLLPLLRNCWFGVEVSELAQVGIGFTRGAPFEGKKALQPGPTRVDSRCFVCNWSVQE